MQRIILDTNVLVSALISNAAPAKILHNVVLKQRVTLLLSNDVFEEYVDVLSRDKFTGFRDFKSRTDIVLTKLKEISTFYQPSEKVDVLTDQSDNKFLELAASSTADYLITGNTNDFTLIEFESTKIITPRNYWDNFWSKDN